MTFNSGIYVGKVRHRRYSPRLHQFSYPIYMMGLDLDEIEQINQGSRLFSLSGFAPLLFRPWDYFREARNAEQLKAAVASKSKELGAKGRAHRVLMLTQVRCLGIYFSPVNFYFCYDDSDHCYGMLAEVSNTPWQEKHYYWVDMNVRENKKAFHVSPYMPMDLQYRWRIKPPQNHSMVHIESHGESKVFDATLQLTKRPLTDANLIPILFKHPMMTLGIQLKIYWQALKMTVKRFPFFSHPKSRGQHGTSI